MATYIAPSDRDCSDVQDLSSHESVLAVSIPRNCRSCRRSLQFLDPHRLAAIRYHYDPSHSAVRPGQYASFIIIAKQSAPYPALTWPRRELVTPAISHAGKRC
jgi:hypothetical protein